MDENQQVLEYIVKCIRDTGSDPRIQIKGYVDSGNDRYITRYGDARNLIKSIVIPARSLMEVSKMLEESEEIINIYIDIISCYL